jgi:cyclophilin family peptidyl-prolyl cis-trans isomerase
MDVVDAIKAVPTGMKNGMADVPETPVEILSARRVE